MGKRDDLIAKYASDLKNKCGMEPDMALLTKVTIGCGPAIYNADAETVAASQESELETVKNNFLIKKLGLPDSPKLMEAIVMGTVIPLVEIELTRNVGSTGGRVTYYKYELTNVMITSYQTGGADAGDRPIEDFSLNFEQIKVIYTEYTTDGQAAGKVTGNGLEYP